MMLFVVFLSTAHVHAIPRGYLDSIGIVCVRVLRWRYINGEYKATRTSGSGEALEGMQINPSRLLDSQHKRNSPAHCYSLVGIKEARPSMVSVVH